MKQIKYGMKSIYWAVKFWIYLLVRWLLTGERDSPRTILLVTRIFIELQR